ncbi:MAG: hypothetical protein J0M24_23300 [Verrucomicrobia bacterium]|nr:hypothetical protein [Verrucomicrobiota bacterium]
MKILSSLFLAGLLASLLMVPVGAQDQAPNPQPTPAEPAPADDPAPVDTDAIPPERPATLPPPVLVTNQAPVPRIPTPTVQPRTFPRPLGSTNFPGRPSTLPAIRPAGPSTTPGAPGAPGTPGAPGAPGTATAPTIITNTVVTPEGESTDIINFKNMPLDQFLDEYATIARRTVLRAANLPLTAQVNFRPASALTPEERLQMYDTILALNGITMIPTGEKAVLAVPSQQALQEGAAFSNNKLEDYAEASQFVTHVVKVEHVNVLEAAETLKQFAKNPNGLLALESTKTLILRDYAINVKRMLEVLRKIDVEVEQEYVFEVIPIKFGKVEELYQTLSSVIGGGGGGATLGTGVRTGGQGNRGIGGTGTGNRFGGSSSTFGGSSRSQYNQGGNFYGQSQGMEPLADGMEPLLPQQVAAPRTTTPAVGGANSFQQRFNSVNRAGMGQGQNLPVSGEPSITPDPRSNSLIIYASKKDMAQLKKIIEKVDTLLAQVLIEGVIMEVGLTSGFSLGVSAAQSPTSYGNNLKTGGAINNTGGNILTNLFPTIPTGGGLTYAMQISSNYNILVSALASDANVNVLQRPRIITSHAVEARFFAGSTIPFVQGSFFGAGTSVGSTYFERQDVGVELDVVPYITKDGLVVMEVSQQIEEIAPNNDGVQTTANAPVTNKRSANSMISVRSGESVLLGGYIRASKANSNSGVPVLKDIPLLGYLFRSTTIDKARTELMILMRPTVLPTPQDAAELTKDYQQDSPQIRMLEEDFRKERDRLNRKAERHMAEDQEELNSGRRSVVEPAPEKYPSNPPGQP